MRKLKQNCEKSTGKLKLLCLVLKKIYVNKLHYIIYCYFVQAKEALNEQQLAVCKGYQVGNPSMVHTLSARGWIPGNCGTTYLLGKIDDFFNTITIIQTNITVKDSHEIIIVEVSTGETMNTLIGTNPADEECISPLMDGCCSIFSIS